MERHEIWSARIEEWRASGKSMSAFSRGQEFTAAGLSYWVRRLASESRPSTKSVRLARVVRTRRATGSEAACVGALQVGPSAAGLIIEAGALRVHVVEQLDCTRLEAVLVAVVHAAKAGVR